MKRTRKHRLSNWSTLPIRNMKWRWRNCPEYRRQGSTIVVVIALLGLLMLLGFTFITFTSQNRQAAKIFMAAERVTTATGMSPDDLFEEALRQLIMGSNIARPNSALYGGYFSILANLIGADIHPNSGIGINIIAYNEDRDGNGMLDPGEDLNNNGILDLSTIAVDQDYDGIADNRTFLNFAHSHSANQGEDLNGNGILDSGEDFNGNGRLDRGVQFVRDGFPAPDAGYTYPDLINLFMEIDGWALNSANRPVRVISPSFVRPALQRNYDPVMGARHPNFAADVDPATAERNLRPHASHLDIDRVTGQPRGFRFVQTLAQANGLGLSGPFPFSEVDLNGNGVLDPAEDTNGNGQWDYAHEQGAWSLAPWRPNTRYDKGQWVVINEDLDGNQMIDPGEDLNGNMQLDVLYFRCSQSGRSGPPAAVPDWTQPQPADNSVVWQNFGTSYYPLYRFDADPDGDGVNEAVYLDLDFPILTRGDGKKYIPLVAFTVKDADALTNVNVSGNANGIINVNQAGVPFGAARSLSRSNMGMSPTEINPIWIFNAGLVNEDVNGNGIHDPGEDDYEDMNSNGMLDSGEDANGDGYLNLGNGNGILDTDLPRGFNPFFAHQAYYGRPRPFDTLECANMELWWLLTGRPDFQTDGPAVPTIRTNTFTGRWGELNRLLNILGGAVGSAATNFPAPGLALEDFNYNGILDAGEDLNNNGILDPHDDNGNSFEGEWVNNGAGRIIITGFGHPLDFRGSGQDIKLVSGAWAPQFYQLPGAPDRWRQYSGFHAVNGTTFPWRGEDINFDGILDPGEDANGNGVLDWAQGGNLMLSTVTTALDDDAAEMIFDARFGRSSDSLLHPSEMFFLHASNGDIERFNSVSRLKELMPYMLWFNNRSNQIRKRLTTESWGLESMPVRWFGYNEDINGNLMLDPGEDDFEDTNLNGIFDSGEDANGDGFLNLGNGNGVLDPPANTRAWEFSAGILQNPSGQQVPVFQFPAFSSLNTGEQQPIRNEVRALMQVLGRNLGSSNGYNLLTQRRLSFNHVVAHEVNDLKQFEDVSKPVLYRKPTTHAGSNLRRGSVSDISAWVPGGRIFGNEDANSNGTLDSGEDLNGNGSLDLGKPDISLLNDSSVAAVIRDQAREWWARHDRQRMARDIYTFLYLFCGGNDDINYLRPPDPSDPPHYTNEQLREMAQFAVNVVDSWDGDIIMTKFEYDKDLSNGWGNGTFTLDDDPFTLDEAPLAASDAAFDRNFPEDGLERGVVYGLEEQGLVLSEALTFKTRVTWEDANGDDVRDAIEEKDHPGTYHDDLKERIFTFIELHNASPVDIDISSEQYQIVVIPIEEPAPGGPPGGGPPGGGPPGGGPPGGGPPGGGPPGGWPPGRPPGVPPIKPPDQQATLLGERRLTLRAAAIDANNSSVIKSAQRFSIGSIGDGDSYTIPGDPTSLRIASNLRVDTTSDGTTPPPDWDVDALRIVPAKRPLDLDLIHPRRGGTGAAELGPMDIDLSGVTAYRLSKAPVATAPADYKYRLFGDGLSVIDGIGEFINKDTLVDPTAPTTPVDERQIRFTLILRRRLHPSRQPPRENAGAGSTMNHIKESQDNPWIEVDRIGFQMNRRGSNPNFPAGAIDPVDPDLTDNLTLRQMPQFPLRDLGFRIYPLEEFESGGGVVAPELAGGLSELWSRERRQPLQRVMRRFKPNHPRRFNSIGSNNATDDLPNGFDFPQPHFDRDFVSAIEVLSVPLYGPETANRFYRKNGEYSAGVRKFLTPRDVGEDLNRNGVLDPGEDLNEDMTLDWGDEDINGNGVLDPFEDALGNSDGILDSGDPYKANRWYRLLSFFGVRSRLHRFGQLAYEDINQNGVLDTEDTNLNGVLDSGEDTNGNGILDTEDTNRNGVLDSVGTYRTPGRINLNTMRYPENLASLIDMRRLWIQDTNNNGRLDPGERSYFKPLITSGLGDTAQTTYLGDVLEPSEDINGNGILDSGEDANGNSILDKGRDWWVQMIQARDGQDPINGMYLPGTVNARPFRDLNFMARGQGSIQNTLLRGHQADLDPRRPKEQILNHRHLHEMGTWPQHENGNVDYHTRNRALAKVQNNSTNRSNVFNVFIEIAFFEVAILNEDDDGDGVLDPGEDRNGDGVLQQNNVRIGAKLKDVPSHRGFFVIDRSLAMERVSAGNFRSSTDPARYSFIDQYEDTDHDGFLDTEDTNGNNMLDGGEDTNGNGVLDTEDVNGNGILDTFDFRDLIIHRQVLD